MPRSEWHPITGIDLTVPLQPTVSFKKLVDNAIVPTRAHATDAGFDLSSTERVHLAPGDRAMVSTGIAVALPANTVGLVCPRSGLAAKHGVTVTNAPGVIDAGYRGELKVILQNTGNSTVVFDEGDRIAQMVVVPLIVGLPAVEVEELPNADRGDNGFGSTGT